MRKNARTSVLVADRSDFGRVATAAGANLCRIAVDLPSDGPFAPLVEAAQDRLICAGNAA